VTLGNSPIVSLRCHPDEGGILVVTEHTSNRQHGSDEDSSLRGMTFVTTSESFWRHPDEEGILAATEHALYRQHGSDADSSLRSE
jgi:hypothetical protein